MKLWIKILIVALALTGIGVAVWYFFIRKKPIAISPAATTISAQALGYFVDPNTGIVSLGTDQSTAQIVGIDNGDDSWTTINGAVVDYNNNYLGSKPLTQAQLVALANAIVAPILPATATKPATIQISPAEQQAIDNTLTANGIIPLVAG